MLFKTWIEWFFPPVCVCCQEPCFDSFFCPTCWLHCEPADPAERCPICFGAREEKCQNCLKEEPLPFRRAAVFDSVPPARYLARHRPDLLAPFAVKQWALLDWPLPDAVVPMRRAKEMARSIADLIDRPYAPMLRRNGCDAEMIEEGQTLLLIDTGNDLEKVRCVISHLMGASPKNGYLLSLFPYDRTHP